jgi:hypothetical protein
MIAGVSTEVSTGWLHGAGIVTALGPNDFWQIHRFPDSRAPLDPAWQYFENLEHCEAAAFAKDLDFIPVEARPESCKIWTFAAWLALWAITRQLLRQFHDDMYHVCIY